MVYFLGERMRVWMWVWEVKNEKEKRDQLSYRKARRRWMMRWRAGDQQRRVEILLETAIDFSR